MPPIDVSTMILAAAPANHGLVAMDRFTVAPGASEEHGNVEVSCPAGGPACVVSVADDGSVRYESTGGMPSVMSAVMDLAAAPANHGLVAMDRLTVAPGASEERGNVEVSCPAGGPACVVSVADDGSVRYESTGGMPSVMSTVMDLAAAPANHGLVAMDRLTVAPGASEERGNVEVSCPAGGPACVVSVADDGSVRYESTGGMPSVMSTVMDLAAAPANHGLVAMDRLTVAPGASEERGNVEVSCPAGGPACVVSVADDGSVRYESTGGMPSVMSAVMDLAAAPANHGLVAMDRLTVAPGASEEHGNVEVSCPAGGPARAAMDRFTVAPGASEERGNVECSCPAGGPACVVSVADDGSVRYESTGGMPSVMSTVMDLAAVPANHGLVAMDRFTVAPGASEERGNVEVSCPAGGPACVVSVADDGSVRYESTGGMPSVMPPVLTSEKIESILNTRLANSNLTIFTDSQYLVNCLSLDCPTLRDIEFRDETVGYDFSNFNFTENRRGVSLAETPIITTTGEHLGEATQTDYKALGGWMEHSFFHIETAHWSYSDGSTLNFEISSGGMATNTNPSEPPGGVATWSGIMFGVVLEASPPDGASFINGDATITADLRSAFLDPRVGVLFSNITNENTGVAIEDMVWTDLRLENGTFSTYSSPSNDDT